MDFVHLLYGVLVYWCTYFVFICLLVGIAFISFFFIDLTVRVWVVIHGDADFI